jgi:hypothetical protein
LRKFVANFDIPNDGLFHAYSFVMGGFLQNGYNQILVYQDGDLKTVFELASTRGFAMGNGWSYFYLYSFKNLKMSDYIWSRDIDESTIVNIHEKMLNLDLESSGNLTSIYLDTDGDQITDLTEQLGGVYDYTLANTDQNTDPNNVDQLDDYIENYIVRYLNGSDPDLMGGFAFNGTAVFDGTQTEFKNYYTSELKTTNTSTINFSLYKDMTISFWFYNTGSLSGGGNFFKNQENGALHCGGISNGVFYIKPNMESNTTIYGTENLWNQLSSNNVGEWCHLLLTSDSESQETKVYINSLLFDTISSGFTRTANVDTILPNGVFNTGGWTHFAMWNAHFDQSKVDQLYTRRSMAQYDIVNSYPPNIISAPDINISEDFFYQETYSNFDDSISQVQVNSTENYTVTISNIDQIPFGIIGSYDVIYKAENDSGFSSYRTQTVTISAADHSNLSTYNNQSMIEEKTAGADVSLNYTLGTSNNFTDVIPAGANKITVSNVSDMSDYANGFTFSIWLRPTNAYASGTLFQFGNLRFYNRGNGGGITIYGPSGGTYGSNQSNGSESWYINAHNGANNNSWLNFTFTWSQTNGLKLYRSSISDTNFSNANYSSLSFSLPWEKPNETGAMILSNSIIIGDDNNTGQRPIDGAQVAKREMTSSEVYSFVRRYIEDRTTILG